MQTAALLHIEEHAPDLPVMRVVPTTAGAMWAEAEAPDGELYLVRAFTLMPGRVARAGDLDDEGLRRFGRTVARVGVALRGFFHPAAGYEILWDLKHASRLRTILASISDRSRRALAERVIDGFDERAAPIIPRLRAQILHNDLTIDNVLIDEHDRVSGIVDFGDLTHTAVVCDLAVALASLMWEQPDPFASAGHAIRGFLDVNPLEEAELELLGDLVAARMVAWGAIAAWRSKLYPENAEYITAGDDLAWELLASFDALGFDDVRRRLRHAATVASTHGRFSSDELLQRRRRVLRRSPLSYERPLHLVRGEGVWMFDHAGRSYLDAYNNVPSVGHSHPRVAEAIARQARILSTNTRYLHEAAIELAERLVASMPSGLETVLLVNSGSEANDVAWQLARAATGRGGAVASAYAYHGLTDATRAVSPEEWPSDRPPSHVALLPAPDGYRGSYRREDERWAERYAAHLDDAAADLRERAVGIAAAFVDPAFTSDGVLVPPREYLRALADRLHRAGGLLVADEVQAGHGRYGSALWSFQASGVEPDLVTLGKPMGNGHPVAAVVARPEIVEALPREIEPFSTFGGNPVSCAAALAVLDVIDEEGLIANAARVGAHLTATLRELAGAHSIVGDVRGAGLMIGIDLVRDRDTREPATAEARAVVNEMRERGVLIGSTGPAGNVLKIRPPLPFSTQHADLLVTALDESLATVTR